MARGVKGSGVGQVSTGGSGEVEKSAVKPTKVIIGSSASVDDMLALDSEGVDLVFEQTAKFLVLDDATVAKMSPLNRTRYNLAREFHDTWRGDDHEAFTERFKVDRQMVGSATDKINVKDPKGLVTRWVLPSKVDDRRAKGYRVLGEDEVKTYLGGTAGHHEIGRMGQTELVLMGVPREIFEKRQAEKVQRNNEMAGAYRRSALSEMNQAGGQPFEAADSARDQGRWKDLTTEENGG